MYILCQAIITIGVGTLVGVTGIEPATSRPPAVRATAALHPESKKVSQLNLVGRRGD